MRDAVRTTFFVADPDCLRVSAKSRQRVCVSGVFSRTRGAAVRWRGERVYRAGEYQIPATGREMVNTLTLSRRSKKGAIPSPTLDI